jgi:preprotein translocase SecE subunit
MKDGKIISGLYIGFFLILSYFFVQATDAVLGMRVIDLAEMRVLNLVPLKGLIGVVLAAATTFYFYKGKKGFYLDELQKAVSELKKVVTPSKEETKVTTISVFVFVGIMVVVFVVFDLIWSNLAALIY